jgi:archaellum component FlaG (FlaF/FlaG flagellin family)
MMTVAAAAAAYFWMTTVQRRIMEAVAAGIERRAREIYYSVKIVGLWCNRTGNNLAFWIQNVGTDEIPSGTVMITVKDSGGAVTATDTQTISSIAVDALSSQIALAGPLGLQNDTFTVAVATPGGAEATAVCRVTCSGCPP